MKIVGHRGALGLASENTKAALIKAIEYKVDEIEIDVRVSKDSQVVLTHNAKINDASGQKLSVKRTNLKLLRAHKPDITTLQEAFGIINEQVVVCIEIKPKVKLQPIIKLIKQQLSNGYAAQYINIASFSFDVLKDIQRQLPEIKLVINERWLGARGVYRARKLNTNRLNINYRWLRKGYVMHLVKNGYIIYAYTVNDLAMAKKLSKIGVVGFITDFPNRLARR